MEGGGGVRASCIGIRYLSLRRVMSRWFSSPGKVKGRKKPMVEGRVTDSPPRTVDSELRRREFLFSIGMSCYLLHLIANGREEIYKIVELRNDIEKLIECKNDEMRRKQKEFVELRNDIDKLLQYHIDDLRRKQQEKSETRSDVVETASDYYYSPQLLETSLSVRGETSFKHYVFNGKEKDIGGKMDQLEAELEAEFELLQIGQSSKDKKEVSEKSGDSQGIKFSGMWSGSLQEQQKGVCPYELERRLHELIETRQEEKINELQSALIDVKRMLNKKEGEASWWKDTAYFVAELVPQPSRINQNSQTRQYPISR